MNQEELKKYLEECNDPKIRRESKNIPINEGFNSINNLQIAYDTTDHFTLICPNCNSDCVISKVETIKKIQIDFEKNYDKVTFIEAYCIKCKQFGRRKIYWNSYLHQGRSIRGRTNWKLEYIKKISNSDKNCAESEQTTKENN